MAEPKRRLSREKESVSAPAEGSPSYPTPKQIIASQLATLTKHHRDTLETGAVEPIHKMRVTTRKLQATLDFLILKPDDLGIRGMKKELRNWRRQLSRVRNYDVFLEMINKHASTKKPVHFQQYQLIANELQKRRGEIFLEVRRTLEDIDLEEFAGRLGLRLGSIGANSEVSPEGASESSKPGRPDLYDLSREESGTEGQDGRRRNDRAEALMADVPRIAARAERRLQQRLREFEHLASAVGPTDDPNDIHQLRIAAKRLRYSMEVVSNLGYGNAHRAMAWLKRFQDRLGDLHDIDSFEEEIMDIIGRRDFIRDHMSESGEMLHAASRLISKRHAMVKKILPARVPPFISATTRRLVRHLSAVANY
jgi:CHAD domain-containing protein